MLNPEDLYLVVVPTCIRATVPATIIALTTEIDTTTPAEVGGRVIAGYCRTTSDAWKCVVLEAAVWNVTLDADCHRLIEVVSNMFQDGGSVLTSSSFRLRDRAAFSAWRVS